MAFLPKLSCSFANISPHFEAWVLCTGMSINFFSEETAFSLPQKLATKAWLQSLAASKGAEIVELNYVFCSDEYLLTLNKEHLNHDFYTDIITFDNGDEESEETEIEGDLFISIDRVRDNAQQHGNPAAQELYRVMAHGLLHLCGYGDKSEEEIAAMRHEEEAALTLLSPKLRGVKI